MSLLSASLHSFSKTLTFLLRDFTFPLKKLYKGRAFSFCFKLRESKTYFAMS